MIRNINGTHDIRIRLVFHVDDTVGKITAAEIDHINDIQIVIGQYG